MRFPHRTERSARPFVIRVSGWFRQWRHVRARWCQSAGWIARTQRSSANTDAQTLRCSKHAAGNRRHLSDQGRRSRVEVSGRSGLLVHAPIRSRRARAVAFAFTVIERIGFRLAFAFAIANTNADTDAIARAERFGIRKRVTVAIRKRCAHNVAHRRLAQRRAQDAESRPEGGCNRRTRHTAFAHRCRCHARRKDDRRLHLAQRASWRTRLCSAALPRRREEEKSYADVLRFVFEITPRRHHTALRDRRACTASEKRRSVDARALR